MNHIFRHKTLSRPDGCSALLQFERRNKLNDVQYLRERAFRDSFFAERVDVEVQRIHPTHRPEHRLVFTDSQYWDSGTAQASLANRTMNAALSDSHCIFIGLSMTDPNLLRWLALRHNEILREAALQAPAILGEGARRRRVEGGEKSNAAAVPDSARSKEESELVKRRLSSSLAGHFWIRTPNADRTGLLSEFLLQRGVEAVEIPSWGGRNFAELLDEMFPAGISPPSQNRNWRRW